MYGKTMQLQYTRTGDGVTTADRQQGAHTVDGVCSLYMIIITLLISNTDRAKKQFPEEWQAYLTSILGNAPPFALPPQTSAPAQDLWSQTASHLAQCG